jgi:predicted acetyltransferase
VTDHPPKPTPEVEVVPAAAEQAPILANLLQLYAHDFSEVLDVEIGEDGRFIYKQLPLYWTDPDRHPFLIWVDGKLAGFVLVKKGSEVSTNKNVWDMSEFFVLRRYRRRGIGTEITHKVWRQFPGAWEVRVTQLNVSAQHFWASAISELTGDVVHPVPFDKEGESWVLFSFDSKSAA